MASVSPQRCSPQLVVKFKSAMQTALCSFIQANELNKEEGHSSKYLSKSILQRASICTEEPWTTSDLQTKQTSWSSAPAAGLHAHPQRPWGKSLTFRLCFTLPPPSQTALGVQPFTLRDSLEGVNKNTYLSVPQMAKTESEQCPVMACQVKPTGLSGSALTTVSTQNHKESPSKELHHKALEEFKILPARHTLQ